MSDERQYKRDLKMAQESLALLLEQREEIETQIARAKRKIALLSELGDESGDRKIPDLDLGGLTEACSTVLRASRKDWMTAGDIQAALKEMGFSLEKYKAPASTITTTVNRLVEAGRVVRYPREGPGVAEYKWIGQVAGTAAHRFAEILELKKKREAEAK
jgi:hypothetical protein